MSSDAQGGIRKLAGDAPVGLSAFCVRLPLVAGAHMEADRTVQLLLFCSGIWNLCICSAFSSGGITVFGAFQRRELMGSPSGINSEPFREWCK